MSLPNIIVCILFCFLHLFFIVWSIVQLCNRDLPVTGAVLYIVALVLNVISLVLQLSLLF